MTAKLRALLNDSNSRTYRSRRGFIKEAHVKWRPGEYMLSWGKQNFFGPHMIVLDPAGEYGVELRSFFTTHQPMPDKPDHYVKTATVRAFRLEEPLELVTIVRGKEEIVASVPAGAYVVQNPDGEQYAMTDEEFHRRYIEDE